MRHLVVGGQAGDEGLPAQRFEVVRTDQSGVGHVDAGGGVEAVLFEITGHAGEFGGVGFFVGGVAAEDRSVQGHAAFHAERFEHELLEIGTLSLLWPRVMFCGESTSLSTKAVTLSVSAWSTRTSS